MANNTSTDKVLLSWSLLGMRGSVLALVLVAYGLLVTTLAQAAFGAVVVEGLGGIESNAGGLAFAAWMTVACLAYMVLLPVLTAKLFDRLGLECHSGLDFTVGYLICVLFTVIFAPALAYNVSRGLHHFGVVDGLLLLVGLLFGAWAALGATIHILNLK